MSWHVKKVKNWWKEKWRDLKKINPKELNDLFSTFSKSVCVSFANIDTPC